MPWWGSRFGKNWALWHPDFLASWTVALHCACRAWAGSTRCLTWSQWNPKKGIVWCCMVGKVNSQSKHWSYMFTKSVIKKMFKPRIHKVWLRFQNQGNHFLNGNVLVIRDQSARMFLGCWVACPAPGGKSLLGDWGRQELVSFWNQLMGLEEWSGHPILHDSSVDTVATVLVFGRLSTSNLAWCF